jgi:hypothetical protein
LLRSAYPLNELKLPIHWDIRHLPLLSDIFFDEITHKISKFQCQNVMTFMNVVWQRWPTGGPRAAFGPRHDLLRPAPSLRFIFSKSSLHNCNGIEFSF